MLSFDCSTTSSIYQTEAVNFVGSGWYSVFSLSEKVPLYGYPTRNKNHRLSSSINPQIVISDIFVKSQTFSDSPKTGYDCIGKLNEYAKRKFHSLNDQYRKYIVGKSEKLKKEYGNIIADGDVVNKHNFAIPETISVRVDREGKAYDNHLFADDSGIARIKLNGWEEGIIEEEAQRADFVCWLRNPPREKWSLCIPYELGGETHATYPDFLIVRSDPALEYIIDILEPHNPDFKDNLGKAKAFAQYAEAEPRIGHIQIIRSGKDAAGKQRFKRLDLCLGMVRDKVLKAVSNDELDAIFDRDGIWG